MLRVRSAQLPTDGWGRLDVTEADISFDEPGEPKTGPRIVPIPPALVNILREWIDTNGLTTPNQLLFRTRNDSRPSGSNWARAWHRALESVGQPPLRVYDCRHAAATTWLRAGMPSPKPHDGSDTASKPSSPPTSAHSTTNNTSPTNESTSTSKLQRRPTASDLRNANVPK